MKPAACTAAAVIAIILAGAVAAEAQLRDYRGRRSDLLRLLAEQPWINLGAGYRMHRTPRYVFEFGTDTEQGGLPQPLDNEDTSYVDDDMRVASAKRSAVATALNAGRRRRQPTPALGKAATPYVGVGVLNDVGSFFDYLRDNLQGLASLSPQQRSTFFQDAPSVVHAPSSGGGGGGTGIRKLHALRPLRPSGNIRSYNRRSYVEADRGYPRANNHDPGLLWTGLGR